MRFAKGHGTGNDFVILPDAGDQLPLTPALVRRLCDRRSGIGADGVLRVVPSGAASLGGSGRAARAATWFMDYLNADGSVAEMCGNGIRVFARYLIDHRLATGPEIVIGTRAGVRTVRCTGEHGDGQYGTEQFSVDMGPARVTGSGTAVIGGSSYQGIAVDVGNPHLACLVDEPLASFDLAGAPDVDPVQFPEGVNVEVVRLAGDRSIEMRVHERGSGETLSWDAGAGAVAFATPTAEWPGDGAQAWEVRVPGGRLRVIPSATASVLTGPAVIVAEGEIDERWLADAGGAADALGTWLSAGRQQGAPA
jgi:diaminopimelate epimerase